jgi:protein-S-isoprenylcysteine O-methyltransferase Ste14
MSDYVQIGLRISWLIVILYWLISAIGSKKAKSQEKFTIQFLYYWLPLIVAILLLGPGEWFGHSLIRENFVSHTDFVGAIGLVFCFTGALIACWSKYLLGKNWSLSVQRKEEHELIQHGIYKFIRHPIYTGLLLLFLGNTIIVGDYRGIIALLIVFVSFWMKLLKEEKLLEETFGKEYVDYKKNTKALFPHVI